MANRWIRDDVHGITTLIADNEYDPSEEVPPFLVDGIVHRSMTLIIGRPEGGKSTLARTIVAGLVNGESEILDRKVLVPDRLKCAIISADPDSAREYAEEFKDLTDNGVDVPIHCPDLPVAAGTWEEMHSLSARNGYQLVVVDNLWQFTPGGDLDDPAALQEFYHQLRWFDNHQIAVILLAHSTIKKSGTTALGHTTIHAGPRWTVQVVGREPSPIRRLDFSGNPRQGESWSLVTTIDGPRVVPAQVVPVRALDGSRRDRALLEALKERDSWASQQDAARALGTTQPKISRLLKANGLVLNRWAALCRYSLS